MADRRLPAYLGPVTLSDDPETRRLSAMRRIEAETGIDEPMIARLVDGFYDRVRADPLIGPVFNQRIRDWGPHLEQMRLFWSSVALMSGAYHGRPMPKHLPLPVDARHFDRWLELFEATARDLCPPAAAEHFIERARRIAESLELGIAGANGVLLAKGERYQRSTESWAPAG
ncbi:group III truncated hemoglobin [uncultured Brevundimonas sp.]|uniref:group III truncated hemoglobin n=1 Tax=uncultured Brevundimonas sp. TaxID=213418 RepID=UPI0026215936|nr:group III truncated hemoglobin [uncultured Brevundimonas sp.]